MRSITKHRSQQVSKPQTPGGMTPEQHAFALEYLANGGNATGAYRKGHPQASDPVCQVEGWRYLRIHKVDAFVQREVQKRLAARQADGDALLGLVIGEAFSDVRQLFDHNGAMLKPQDWPDSIVNCVEGVEVREDGIRVKLTSKSQARRFLLELLGRTRSTAVASTIWRRRSWPTGPSICHGEIRDKR